MGFMIVRREENELEKGRSDEEDGGYGEEDSGELVFGRGGELGNVREVGM